jgi:hypothetical protein
MKTILGFLLGGVAAVLDHFGLMAARNRVMALAPRGYGGKFDDGFDVTYDRLIQPISPWWRRFYRAQRERHIG